MAHLQPPLAAYESVKVWRAGYAKQWGEQPGDEARLRELEAFCVFVGKAPDELIADCLRQVTAGKKIRTKARQRYMEKIKEFEAGAGGSRTQGNIIRSFFIYNGVAMSSGILR